MYKIVFSSSLLPRKSSEINALLLVESIRAFAGSLSQTPIWIFTPDYGKQPSQAITDRLRALKVKLIPYKIDKNALDFPFIEKVYGTSSAESVARGQTDLLGWFDTNTLMLQEPKDFLLQDDKSLGFRPVHHTLIGSRFDESLDPFWTLIYQHCKVPKDRVFPMMTHVDNTRIRPYFNTGLLITRPETRLLRSWRDTFVNIYREPSFQAFYQQDPRYRTFMHQAVLSGVILSTLTTNEIQELPTTYNYPLHLHEEDVSDHRPSSLEELVTLRHEGFYEDVDWSKKMPAKKPLKQWIAKRLF